MVHLYTAATKQRLYEAMVKRFGGGGVRAENMVIAVLENGFEDSYAGRL
jgi:predicted sulfurtransferase